MNKYQIETTTTMKEYNNKKWWIDSDTIRTITISAENITEALKEYQKIVSKKYYIDISNNALKNKSPMYVDDKNGNAQQVGYVITAKTEFEDNAYR